MQVRNFEISFRRAFVMWMNNSRDTNYKGLSIYNEEENNGKRRRK